MRHCAKQVTGLVGALCLLLTLAGGHAMAEDWQLFGLTYFSGNLGYSFDSLRHGTPSNTELAQYGYETLQLNTGAFIFNPRFINLDVDTTLQLFPGGSQNAAPYQNRGGTVTVLADKPVSFGATVRSQIDQVKQTYAADFSRTTDIVAGWFNVRFGPYLQSLRYEVEADRAPGAPIAPEDLVKRTLSLKGGASLPWVGVAALTAESVDQSNSITTVRTSYVDADVTASGSYLHDKVHLNTTASFLHRTLPTLGGKYNLSTSATIQYDQSLTSAHHVELSRVDDFNLYDMKRFDSSLEKILNSTWRVAADLGMLHSISGGQGADTLQAGTKVNYSKEWPGGARWSGTEGLTYQNVTSTGKLLINQEAHTFGTSDMFLLAVNGVDLSTIRVTDQVGSITYNQGVAYDAYLIDPDGTVQLVRRRYNPDTQNDANHIPQGGTVLVSYQVALPGNRYSNLVNLLNIGLAKELRPGLGLETAVNLKSTLPLAQEGLVSGVPNINAQELTVSAYLKNGSNEFRTGVNVGPSRTLLNASFRGPWHNLEYAGTYQGLFYPDLTGHVFDTSLTYALRIWENTHVDLLLTDHTYLANDAMNQAITTVGASLRHVFTPRATLETSSSYEYNRVVDHDQKSALNAKFQWHQGQLLLEAGCEYKFRLIDQFLSNHVYINVKRYF